MTDVRSRRAVEVAEGYADDPVPTRGRQQRLQRARLDAMAAVRSVTNAGQHAVPSYAAAMAAQRVTGGDRSPVSLALSAYTNAVSAICRADAIGFHALEASFADVVRDVYRPYRRPVLAPSWRTFTVLTLAHRMYETRDFGSMPILADALQDAGCDDSNILDHCRGPGPHVRGCWAIDLVLDRR